MNVRRRFAGLAAATTILVCATVPAQASPVTDHRLEFVADGSAVAFALRPSYDAGGAAPLHLYMGYADANVTTPEPVGDGQASWYNLNIIETAAFQPWEQCTAGKNVEATRGGLEDVQAWASEYIQEVAASIAAQEQPSPPTIPGPRRACTERFPGFAQSRYPATATMGSSARDNYLDKPAAAFACREDPGSSQCASYSQHWPGFRSSTGKHVRDGSFEAETSSEPGQRSQALLFGVGDGVIVSIGLARTTAEARVEQHTLVTEATTELNDICVMATTAGCTLHIDSMRQAARVVQKANAKPERSASTVIKGVRGAGVDREITATDLRLHQTSIDFGGYFTIDGVSTTHSCDPAQDDPSIVVADAGGLRIGGSGGAGRQGGSITIGGACARAQAALTTTTFTSGGGGDDGPPLPPVGSPPIDRLGPVLPGPGEQPPMFGPARVVSRSIVSVTYREPIAWRTAPYWGSALGALVALAVFGYLFRRTPVVAPAARAVDRFARQFLRG